MENRSLSKLMQVFDSLVNQEAQNGPYKFLSTQIHPLVRIYKDIQFQLKYSVIMSQEHRQYSVIYRVTRLIYPYIIDLNYDFKLLFFYLYLLVHPNMSSTIKNISHTNIFQIKHFTGMFRIRFESNRLRRIDFK